MRVARDDYVGTINYANLRLGELPTCGTNRPQLFHTVHTKLPTIKEDWSQRGNKMQLVSFIIIFAYSR